MAAFRYWRLVVFRSAATGSVVVVEMAIKDVTGGTDLTIASLATGGGVPSAQGFNSPSQSPDKAFDQSTTDWWVDAPATLDSWLQFDFQAPVSANEVDLTFHTDPLYQPATVTIWASNDLQTWFASPTQQPKAFNAFSATFDTTTMAPINYRGLEHLVVYSPGLGPNGISAEMHILVANPQRSSGVGKIAGEVDVTGTPPTPVAAKEVRLHDRVTGALYATTHSADDGTYEFTALPLDRAFYVIAFDETLNYNAVIKDNIVPVLA